MEQKVLLINEVALMLRVAPVTIRRWIHLSRNGKKNFPLPISVRNETCKWLSSDIEFYLQSRSAQCSTAPPNVNSLAQQKREAKTFEQRQVAAKRVLDSHRKKL